MTVVVYAILVRIMMTFLLVTPPPAHHTVPQALGAAPEMSAALLHILSVIHVLLGVYVVGDTLATAIRCGRLRLWDGVAAGLALFVVVLLHVAVAAFL